MPFLFFVGRERKIIVFNFFSFVFLMNKSRIQIWEVINYHDNYSGVVLQDKLIKIYESVTIISILVNASLIALNETNNNTVIIINIYDGVRSFGILVSILNVTISITLSVMITAIPYKYTIDFVYKFSKIMSMPLILTIFSLTDLTICTTLYFDENLIFIIFPFSFTFIIFSFYNYFYIRYQVVQFIKDDIKIINNIKNNKIEK
jgi:hypothetical protein